MQDNNTEKLMNNEERINRYLKGMMTPEEEAAFKDDIKKDEELRSQTEALAHLVKAMNVAGKEYDQKIIADIKRMNRPSHIRQYMAIAACILCLCIMSFKGYDYITITELGDEYAQTFPTSTIIRGEDCEKVEEELQTLFSNIEKSQELASTLAQLTKLWQESQQDTYNDYTDYAPYIGWYLAVGHLKNYDKDEALNVLHQMEKVYPANTAVGEKVKELIEKI